MNDERAQAAYDVYRDIIRRYRNPSIAPHLHDVMMDLNSACDYLNSIPRNQRTPAQDHLRIKISGLLMRDNDVRAY